MRGGHKRSVRGGPLRHWGGFLAAGLSAAAVDAAVLTALTSPLIGLSPYLARPPAIALAMVVSWLINRTVTFPVAAPPALAEFARFAAVAWATAALNYAVFAGLLLAWPALHQLIALILSSGVAMIAAYAGMRFAVFRVDR